MSKSDTKEGSKESVEAETNPIREAAANYTKAQFNRELEPKFLFHNFAYAKEIADKVEELAKAADLDQATIDLLIVAAYFYPLGYIDGPSGVAMNSVKHLTNWGKQEAVKLTCEDGAAPDWVRDSYTADENSSLPARILHDAAHSWYGRKRYDRRSKLLQLEREALEGKEGDPVKFGNLIQETLLHFKYLTKVGYEEFDLRRRKNVAAQQKSNYKIQQKEVKAKTGKNFGRGIDTMYRTAFRNHINLSRIADGKANMMISINTIILSIVITISGASLSFFEETFFENPEFLIPIISLLLSSLIAVIFAVFSARPSVTEYRIKKDKLVKSQEASLLYFGNFLKLEKADFLDYMSEMKHDQNALYDDLSRDLYDLGTVLHKKYLLLTISYNTFVGGLALAVISFLIVYMLNVFTS